MVWIMPIASFGLPKVVVGVPRVLKVLSWVFRPLFRGLSMWVGRDDGDGDGDGDDASAMDFAPKAILADMS